MIQIETQRLKMYPLDSEALSALVLRYKEINEELSIAYKEMLDGVLDNADEYEWYSPWEITLKESNLKIGYAGFHGACVNGIVEIGYGIDEECRNNGYATEAVFELCRWALKSDGVNSVEAEACIDNMASIKVLYKCGFAPTGEKGIEGIRFRRTFK